MTQCELIVDTFRRHNWQATLGELITEGTGTFAHELRSRFSDLRRKGYRIDCTPGPNPSKNLYTMMPPVQFDETGQGVLLNV